MVSISTIKDLLSFYQNTMTRANFFGAEEKWKNELEKIWKEIKFAIAKDENIEFQKEILMGIPNSKPLGRHTLVELEKLCSFLIRTTAWYKREEKKEEEIYIQ